MSSNAPESRSASLGEWRKAAAKSAPGGDVDALNWVTPDGIAVKARCIPSADLRGLAHTDTLPGFAPFLRGAASHDDVRRAGPGPIRQHAGFSTAEGIQRLLPQAPRPAAGRA